MKEYGFDYMNYITNVPSNMMDMSGKYNMKESTNMFNKFKMNNMVNMKGETVEPYEGFIRGNLFENLYDQYKDYKPRQIDANNEREALLYQIMQYKFALIELNLYLDTNPNDKINIELYNKYLNMEKQMCDQYERMYGPLTVDSNYLNKDNWTWKNSPWPWEVM